MYHRDFSNGHIFYVIFLLIFLEFDRNTEKVEGVPHFIPSKIIFYHMVPVIKLQEKIRIYQKILKHVGVGLATV